MYDLLQIAVYAAKDPWSFLAIVIIILAPLFMICAYCAWKLVKDIDRKDKEKRKKAKREANLNKARRHTSNKSD